MGYLWGIYVFWRVIELGMTYAMYIGMDNTTKITLNDIGREARAARSRVIKSNPGLELTFAAPYVVAKGDRLQLVVEYTCLDDIDGRLIEASYTVEL